MIEPTKDYFVIQYAEECRPSNIKGSLLFIAPNDETVGFAVILQTPMGEEDRDDRLRVGDTVYVLKSAAHKYERKVDKWLIHRDYIMAEYLDK